LHARPLLHIDEVEQGGVRLSGELDLWSAPELVEALMPRIAHGGDLVVDLAAVTFMDGAGLRPLLAAANRLAGRGRVFLKSPSSPVYRVLDLVHAERFPNIEIEGGSTGSRERARVRHL
jgi:anti-anti-sigma factor